MVTEKIAYEGTHDPEVLLEHTFRSALWGQRLGFLLNGAVLGEEVGEISTGDISLGEVVQANIGENTSTQAWLFQRVTTEFLAVWMGGLPVTTNVHIRGRRPSLLPFMNIISSDPEQSKYRAMLKKGWQTWLFSPRYENNGQPEIASTLRINCFTVTEIRRINLQQDIFRRIGLLRYLLDVR